MGAQGIDRSSRRGAIESAANQPIGGNSGTAAVEPEEDISTNLFGLGVAPQYSAGDAEDAPVVLPKNRFKLRFYPAIAHADHVYTSITIGLGGLCREMTSEDGSGGWIEAVL
jgi:hypothetical protein